MVKIRYMKANDVDKVAKIVALDHDADPKKGFREARQHTLDHLKIVPKNCYIVETDNNEIIGVMVLHPQDKIFEIEDFHVKQIQQNKQALQLLKKKLLEYLELVNTEVLCCPFALKRLITKNQGTS